MGHGFNTSVTMADKDDDYKAAMLEKHSANVAALRKSTIDGKARVRELFRAPEEN
jgi:hypothetical protein